MKVTSSYIFLSSGTHAIQVYLPALAGHVPSQMVRTFHDFLSFTYLVRRAIITEETLVQIDAALASFHKNREIFYQCGVRPNGFSLPRQHSLVHYRRSIHLFGAPNDLCSSITESKHIKAVKEPWRRSNHFQALGQMLITNQRLDKLAACRVDFQTRGMLKGPCLADHLVALPPADSLHTLPPQGQPDDGNDDGDAIDDPRILNHVTLPNYPGQSYSLFYSFPQLILC
jgi:hypothetical protein